MTSEVDIVSLAEQAEEEFIRLFNEFNVSESPDRKRADIIDSFWTDIYKKVFKPSPEDARKNNCNSKLKTYDVRQVQDVVEMYIKLCKRYGGVIKFNQFSNLTGLHRSTLSLWQSKNHTKGYIFNLDDNGINEENNSIIYILDNNGLDIVYNCNSVKDKSGIDWELSTKRFDVYKKLREEMQDSNTNGLSIDTMGHTVRANQDDELGKLYEPKRMLQYESIKQTLTADQLPRLDASPQIVHTIADNSSGEMVKRKDD